MSKCSQFLLLLWKNWTLQKRGVIKTIFEIGLPLFFILILVLLRVTKVKDKHEAAVSYNAFDIGSVPAGLEKFRQLAFTPNNTEVAEVLSVVCRKLSFAVPKGFSSESKMVDFLSSSFENKNKTGKYLGGIVFNTKNFSEPHISYKIRLSSREKNTKKQRENLFQDQSTSWHTKFMFPKFQQPRPRNKDAVHGGPPGYYDEGFLTLQLAIDAAIMEYKTTKKETHVTIFLRRFPYPAYVEDPFIVVIQQSVPALLMLSLVFTALNIVRSVVYEKEKKLKESMKMMGLSGWLHWTAWFCKYLLYLLITMAIATILFTVKFNSNGRVLNKSDPSLIFVFLLLYATSSVMFCFCVSVFFSKANLAAAAGGIIWYLSYTPYYFISQSYDNMSLTEKLVSCLLSNVAMGMGAQVIGKFEGTGAGVQWSNITKGVSVDDSFSLGFVLLMFLADSVLYGIITWYVEAVFPGDYGVPQRWYFPVLPSYWCGTRTKVELEDESSLMNGSTKCYGATSNTTDTDCFFEKDPLGLNVGVRMNNLKKVFSTEQGDKIAVNDVSLNLYSGQITALLGHNGAGKTTLMSMLTGLFPPTSGSATVNGYDIVSDIAGVRQSLGICPQHDILFDSLTVEEHLWFFAKLKGCPSRKVDAEVWKMINAVGLMDKKDTQARALSGGMKRKLSIGIALIADSKIVMLDEPTSGMDPSARRFTWDLIQQQRAGRTILLTTHFMDEADLLGDRIAIMAEGTVKCCGSPLFLKRKYGVGYHMIMVKEPGCNIGMVNNVITRHVPTAQLESNIGAELSFSLPNEATGKFEELFTELENRKGELGIASYGASVTTMEEVFLKVGEGMDSTLGSKLVRDIAPQDGVVASNENARLGRFDSEASINLSNNYSHNTGMVLSLQRWRAMFVKKFLHSKRHKVSILFQLLLPLIFTLIALVNAKTFPKPTDSPSLTLVPDRFGSNFIPVRYSGFNRTSKAHALYQEFVNQFEGTKSQTVGVSSSEDMQNYLLQKARSDGLGYFNRKDLLAANFDQEGETVNITAWFNNQPYHAIAISLAAAQNAVFRFLVGKDYTLTTINHPLPRSAKDKIDDLSRDVTGFLISFTLLFSMAFLASSFILFLVQERSNKAKHVQFVSGVDPVSYWTSAYLWDMINFMIPSCALLILFVAFDVPAYRGVRLGYVFLVMVMYGWGVLPLMYLFSFVFKTPSTAFVILAIFNILTGLATLMTVNILSIPALDLSDVARALKWAFVVLPNYCLGQGLSDIFNNYNSINIFNRLVNLCMITPSHLIPHDRKSCERYVREDAGKDFQFQTNYLAWDNPGVGRYLVFLAIEGAVFFLFVLMIEYDVFRFVWNCKGQSRSYQVVDTSLPEDDDVSAEKERISSGQVLPDVLVIEDLTKVFRGSMKGCCQCSSAPSAPLVAVDHLSLGISQGECFGLLGINGAGKTTTFRMLTGDETMTSGTAVLDSYDIRENMSEVRQRLGYCPQFDALIGEMTGRELLFMYARLRGVPEVLIPEVVENLIQMLLLEDHADKVSKSYSGGNKRKLSTAISLVGDPPVVFLDEPTTGMDPVARRLLWNTLSRVRAEGRSIVITSHSMDECEALCTRLAIMVNGRFKCLGSTQHLKTKFGQGYTLLAKVGPSPQTNMLADTRPLKQFIEGAFPESILKDEHEGMVHYHICNPNISWAQIFGILEQNKLNYCIEDYSVSQTSLEQVFLNFARSQREVEE